MRLDEYQFLLLIHIVWKSPKKSHSWLRAKRAMFTFWVDKSSLKMPKMAYFGEFLKYLKLIVKQCYQTGQKMVEMPKLNKLNETFWVIFKHCKRVFFLNECLLCNNCGFYDTWTRALRDPKVLHLILKCLNNGQWSEIWHVLMLCLLFLSPFSFRQVNVQPQCLKIIKKCRIWILALSTYFCPFKCDLSGNTIWPQTSGFQKLTKMDQFWHF